MTATSDDGEGRACSFKPSTYDIATGSLDLTGTHTLEIIVPLLDHERADVEFESWPGPVKLRVVREFNKWRGQRSDVSLVMVSCGVASRCCVFVAHYKR